MCFGTVQKRRQGKRSPLFAMVHRSSILGSGVPAATFVRGEAIFALSSLLRKRFLRSGLAQTVESRAFPA